MQSAIIVHSRHTKNYARSISKKYKDASFLEVKKYPTIKTLKIKTDKDLVIGIGGGSVIDTAKIISKDKRCLAIPTTASGASMTPYATVWLKKRKLSVPTKKPILRIAHNISRNLPLNVQRSTMFDALSHAVESFWSKNSTLKSRAYSKKAITMIMGYINNNNVDTLINAGNLAGQAIAITKTNIIHAASYPLTIEYGIDHGTACGMLLPYFIEYMDFKSLPELFGFNSNEDLAELLKKLLIIPKIRNLDIKLISGMILKYNRIKHGPKRLNKNKLEMILENAKKGISSNWIET